MSFIAPSACPNTNVTVIVDLDCATDSVTVCQGTDPWNVRLDAFTLAALETVTVLQGTSPWIVGGTVTVLQGTSPWIVGGTVTVLQGTSPWVVSAVDLDIRNLDCLTDSVEVCQGTIPWVISGTVQQGTPPWTIRIQDGNGAGLADVATSAPVGTEQGLVTRNIPSGVQEVQDDDLILIATDIKRSVTDFRTLLDYELRLDGNPVYVGKNLQTALIATPTWTIQKLHYDILNRLIDAQVLVGSWTGRAALAWKPAGGD